MDHPQVTNLYKYRTFSSRALSMLANNELYFAVSDSFNDPFDCRARREYEFKDDNDFVTKWTPLEASHQNISVKEAFQYLKEVVADKNLKEEYIARKSNEFQKTVLQSFGVCSFSEVRDDILMWSHYSDGHKGFCIKFNRAPDNMLAEAKPVDYPKSNEFPYINYWLGKTQEQVDEVETIVLTKSRHWDYEEEWRLIAAPDNLKPDYKGHEIEYPDNMLSGIIFGSRMNKKNRATLKTILSGKPTEFYEARVVKNKFQLEIIKAE